MIIDIIEKEIEMKKGDVVNIYQKSMTKEDFEGKAKLVEEYRQDQGDGLSIWIVEFLDEPGTTYTRTIYDGF